VRADFGLPYACIRDVGGRMACKACSSDNLQKLDAELTASLPVVKAVTAAPVYVCQKLLVCMDCGFAEFVIPDKELQSLKDRVKFIGS